MKKLFTIIILLLSIGLIGCATTAKYEAKLASWVNVDESQLINSWGVPTKTYESGDTKFLTYIYNGGAITTHNVYQTLGAISNTTQYTCTTTFTIRNEKVVNWSWKGNVCTSK